MDEKKKCLLKLSPNALLIANTGEPFSRLGVISICASHHGTKSEDQPIDLYEERKDIHLPKAIREKQIEIYKLDKNILLEHYKQERETSFDYGGRFLWELLQNSDDAMCPPHTPPSDLIGIKGLGFKSVLEITDRPTIYSDPFSFYFSAVDTQTLLIKKGINDPPPLTFRIPHDDPNVEEILDLVDEYPTIISLPFRDNIARGKVERKLENLSPFFLLLSQYVNTVEVVWPDGRSRIWKIVRDKDGEINDGDIFVELVENGSAKTPLRFRRWSEIWSPKGVEKRHSTSICLPLSSTGEVQAWEDRLPLYSFFPTEDYLPFRALIHASFDLDQSRKHVRDHNNEDILAHIEELLGRVVDSIPPEISLRSFFTEDEPHEKTIAYKLRERFELVLRQKKFVSCVGGNKATPPKSHLWKYDLGNVLKSDQNKVAEENLVEPKLLKDIELKKALDHLGAEPLQEESYLKLLQYCKNDNREDCQKSLKTFFEIIEALVKYIPDNKLDLCRKIPCWMLSNGKARSLSGTVPLLRKKPDLIMPSWLEPSVLDAGFLEHLNEIETQKDKKGPSKIWEKIVFGKLINDTNDELLKHLLIPTIEIKREKEWWERHGLEVLHLYQSWAKDLKFKGSPVSIWGDHYRERLGSSLLLPTDKGWIPARKCYAGESWGGPKFFDTFFRDIEERGVMKQPERWPVDIEGRKHYWENILRYAGVSWEMKLIRRSESENEGWEIHKQSTSWRSDCPFTLLTNEKAWSDYFSSLLPPDFNKKTKFDFDTKIFEQWGIEFFPDALPEGTVDRINAIKAVAKEAQDSMMRYTFLKGGRGWGRNKDKMKSFAKWQIEEFPWLPCKQGLLDFRELVPPSKAYMPGKGMGGLLPELKIEIPDGQEGRDLATFLTQNLKVRESLPFSGEVIWKEWIEQLPSAAQRTKEHGILIKATRMLYRRFFEIHDEKPAWLDEIVNIPSLKWDSKENCEKLSFESSPIYWLDQPYLAEPTTRSELLRKFNIFILEQKQGKVAAEWYGIEPLSKLVKVNSQYCLEDHDSSKTVQNRYAERFNSLKVVSGLAALPKPEGLKILAVDNLRLKIIIEEEVIAAPGTRYWKENGIILLESSKKWEALGLALAEKGTRKDLSNTFENLLKAKDKEEVLQRLRDLGVSETEIEDLESDFQEAVDNSVINAHTQNTGQQTDDNAKDNSANKVENQTVAPAEKKDSKSVHDSNGREKKQKRGTVGSTDRVSQSRRQKGKDAESWIRSKISDLLAISDWRVSGKPERDNLNRESDIVLSHYTLGEYHIEVKHVETGEIFWSEGEVSKAKDHTDNYWMVLVRPGYDQSDENIIWLWNPLEDLQNLPRRGKWSWNIETDASKITIKGWDIPFDRKTHEATTFTFVITGTNEFFNKFRLDSSMGLECLKKRLDALLI